MKNHSAFSLSMCGMILLLIAGVFLSSPPLASATEKELVADYNKILLSLTEKELDGYPVAPISPLMDKIYESIETGRLDEARQMLDIVKTQLHYLEQNHRYPMNPIPELLFARVTQGILKYFLLLIFLGLLLSALPILKNHITEISPVRTNLFSLAILTATALFGTRFLWNGKLEEQVYFVDLGTLIPLLSSFATGPLLGGLVGLICSLARIFLSGSWGVTALFPALAGILGMATVVYRKRLYQHSIAIFAVAAFLGLAQGTVVYGGNLLRLETAPLLLSVFSIGFLYGAGVLTFFFFLRVILDRERQRLMQCELLEAKVGQLQNQIKPHFLYHAVSTLAGLYKKQEGVKASDLADKFSGVLRKMVQTNETWVSLEDALSEVKLYLEIEQTRFPDKVDFQIQTHTDVPIKQIRVPVLTIQPLVENAVKHGIKNKPSQGRVEVRVEEKNGEFVIQVSDNGVGMSRSFKEILAESPPSGLENIGIGLRNIHMRLLYLGIGDGLTIQTEKGRGTRVSFAVPKKLACPALPPPKEKGSTNCLCLW